MRIRAKRLQMVAQPLGSTGVAVDDQKTGGHTGAFPRAMAYYCRAEAHPDTCELIHSLAVSHYGPVVPFPDSFHGRLLEDANRLGADDRYVRRSAVAFDSKLHVHPAVRPRVRRPSGSPVAT